MKCYVCDEKIIKLKCVGCGLTFKKEDEETIVLDEKHSNTIKALRKLDEEEDCEDRCEYCKKELTDEEYLINNNEDRYGYVCSNCGTEEKY